MSRMRRVTLLIVVGPILCATLAGCGDSRPAGAERRDQETQPATQDAGKRSGAGTETRRRSGGTGYRFVKPPIVIYSHFQPSSKTNMGFATYVRLNRQRPLRSGLFLNDSADRGIDERTENGRPYIESTRPWCYSQQTIDSRPPELRYPRLRNGQRVIVTLKSKAGRTLARATVRATRVTAEFAQSGTVLRKLGCGPAP